MCNISFIGAALFGDRPTITLPAETAEGFVSVQTHARQTCPDVRHLPFPSVILAKKIKVSVNT